MAVQMLHVGPMLSMKPLNECCTFWDPDSLTQIRLDFTKRDQARVGAAIERHSAPPAPQSNSPPSLYA